MSGSDGGGVSNGAKLKTIQESSKLKTSDGSGGGSIGSVKNIYKSQKNNLILIEGSQSNMKWKFWNAFDRCAKVYGDLNS